MRTNRRQFGSIMLLGSLSIVQKVKASTPQHTLPIEQYQGQLVLVDFWASWCLPCKRSFPWLNKMQSKYKNSGLVILGVNLDEERNDADLFLQDIKPEFPIIFDPQGNYAKQYQLQAMPSSLIFDRSGSLVKTHLGFHTEKIPEYEATLEQLLVS